MHINSERSKNHDPEHPCVAYQQTPVFMIFPFHHPGSNHLLKNLGINEQENQPWSGAMLGLLPSFGKVRSIKDRPSFNGWPTSNPLLISTSPSRWSVSHWSLSSPTFLFKQEDLKWKMPGNCHLLDLADRQIGHFSGGQFHGSWSPVQEADVILMSPL